jgi:hypothetical protein
MQIMNATLLVQSGICHAKKPLYIPILWRETTIISVEEAKRGKEHEIGY